LSDARRSPLTRSKFRRFRVRSATEPRRLVEGENLRDGEQGLHPAPLVRAPGAGEQLENADRRRGEAAAPDASGDPGPGRLTAPEGVDEHVRVGDDPRHSSRRRARRSSGISIVVLMEAER
jgi:hypothetical protein